MCRSSKKNQRTALEGICSPAACCPLQVCVPLLCRLQNTVSLRIKATGQSPSTDCACRLRRYIYCSTFRRCFIPLYDVLYAIGNQFSLYYIEILLFDGTRRRAVYYWRAYSNVAATKFVGRTTINTSFWPEAAGTSRSRKRVGVCIL